MPVQIDWPRIGREQFERVVEALLVRVYRDDTEREAIPVDGRGGDGGRDVDVRLREDDSLEGIYQLKYFPEGFSGGFAKTRKAQIRRSFDAAIAHSPRWWILVIPTNPTPKERSWVRSLAQRHKLSIKIMGRAQLDEELARYPDLLDAFTREPLVQILKETGGLRAGLVRSSDLDETLSDLHRRIDGRSAYWGEKVRLERGATVRELYAKDPRAAELEPIRLTLETAPEELDDATRARLTRVLEFGDGHVVLPPAAVRAFTIEGPEWIASRDENIEIEIAAIFNGAATSHSIELRVPDAEGLTEAAIRGRTTQVTRGTRGMTLRAEFPGGLRLTFRLPGGSGEQGGLDAAYDIADEDVVAAERALRVSSLLREGRPTELWIEGRRLGSVVGSVSEGSPPDLGEDPYLHLSDLAVVSKEFDVPLAYPRRVSTQDRVDIRMLRLLLEGNCVLLAGVGGMTATLSGETSPELEAFLNADARGIAITSPRAFEVEGHQLPLESLRVFHPTLRVTNGAALVELLHAGSASGAEVVMTPTDGTPFRAVLVDRVADPDAPLVPVPLGIPGIPEHPALDGIIRRAAEGGVEG